MGDRSRQGPVTAGIVTAVVGPSSSVVVVLAGLTAVGASPAQAASGLLTLLVTQALGMLWLSVRHRTPIILAWSTPGAALLASMPAVAGGWPAAVAAFGITGLLILLTVVIPRLGDLVAAIPASLAQGMLAGVLVPLCLAPVTALAGAPLAVAPVVLIWLVLLPVSRRWAVPAALGVALVVVLVTGGGAVSAADLVPALSWTTPRVTLEAVVAVSVPLYVVTMASQNVPGVAVLTAHGYRTPWRESLIVTGLGTTLGATTGGHAINLAAIAAALAAGPEAGRDPNRRWIAGVTTAVTMLVLAAASGALATLVQAAPDGVMQAAAGLALLGTLSGSLLAALSDPRDREAAVLTVLIAASGVAFLGIGAAFWALAAGLVIRHVMRLARQGVPV
ncbi:benzoate/H(+) symporter BenE family transporter [Myceligenerans pegani]|uniref:Benzoate/H(+) symporter BenE family transporter n=1 Tax=Myceligenerans pegani TaxID=2776917 RepID=A0ABR9N2U7_9MICO|nr:benzoate/H(+) symporter BenE family transporter [Myceligenerans sp. TRM 65318]MBE1877601.1 benzoate/H(+) symporter BenE family transporter [Myceligenerans sp. TRM 65318]MBE3019872.1 benzoate/H(+) symporter BenE family transporter [Myceligenerans sp. TRM 65318]